MKQAKLFSFFKKSTDQSTTTTAAPPAVSASNNIQKESDHAEENVDNQQQQLLETLPVQQAVKEVQTQPESKAETEVDHAIVDDESTEQSPSIIPQSQGRSNNNKSNSRSTSNVLTSGNNQMSEYERIREENIRRNQAFLMSLGLVGPDAMKPMTSVQTTARSAPKKRKFVEEPTKAVLPTRRSTRVAVAGSLSSSKTGGSIYAEPDENEEDEEEEEEEGVYDDSSVHRYIMCTSEMNQNNQPQSTTATVASSSSSKSDGRVHSLSLLSDNPMMSPSLTAVYSLQFHPFAPVLLAAGKGGYVSMFRTNTAATATATNTKNPNDNDDDDGDENDDELLSFKAHDSWVAAAKFIIPPQSSSTQPFQSQQMLCVTAGNDGWVKLWDVNRQKQQSHKSSSGDSGSGGSGSKLVQPLLLCQTRAIHATKGVFSLDIWTPRHSTPIPSSGGSGYSYGCGYLEDVRIVTGSKDHQVCVSRLVMKSSSSGINAKSSASNSGSSGSGGMPCFEGIIVEREFDSLHRGVVKSVHWQPSVAGQIFASGSQDRSVCIKDCRCVSPHPNLRLDNVHTGGVHTVVWGDEGSHLLLTAGGDPFIHLYDIRQASSPLTTTTTISSSSSSSTTRCFSPHTSPWYFFLLLTRTILSNPFPLQNVRFSSCQHCCSTVDFTTSPGSSPSPYDMLSSLRFSFHGHAASHVKKHSAILPPRFLSLSTPSSSSSSGWNGSPLSESQGSEVIVAAGEGSDCLSLYCTKTGATLSRGAMPDQPIAIAIQPITTQISNNNNGSIPDVIGMRQRPLIAVACKRGGAVYKLQPNTG